MKGYCCDGMKHALEEGYLHQPMLMITEIINGKKRATMKPAAPALVGPALPRVRRRKPALVLSFCPWCKKLLKNKDGTSKL